MTDERLEAIYAQMRTLFRELDPELSDDQVEVALARVLFYAEREKKETSRSE